MTKPHAEIRKALVEGIMNSDKPASLKAAAEIWIGVIDNIEKHGANPQSELAFKMAHRRFLDAANDHPSPNSFPPRRSPRRSASAVFNRHPSPQQEQP